MPDPSPRVPLREHPIVTDGAADHSQSALTHALYFIAVVDENHCCSRINMSCREGILRYGHQALRMGAWHHL